MQHNNSVVLHVHGGPRILLLFRTITECHGMSFAQHSMGTTFQPEPCTVTCKNSWIYRKGLTMCTSTSKSSITWHNTILIMLIPMRRRQSYSEEDRASLFRTAWFGFVTCHSTLLRVPRLPNMVPTEFYWQKKRRERRSCQDLQEIVLRVLH
jgi:hypothetical protein